jgi:hypothetical protein
LAFSFLTHSQSRNTSALGLNVKADRLGNANS